MSPPRSASPGFARCRPARGAGAPRGEIAHAAQASCPPRGRAPDVPGRATAMCRVPAAGWLSTGADMFRVVSDLMLRVLGWRSLLIHGDPCVLDRWLWLRSHLRTGPARTLDAGCGNGAFSIYAAREGNQVLATSFSERELDDARRRTELLGLGGRGVRGARPARDRAAPRRARELRPDHLPGDDRAPQRRPRPARLAGLAVAARGAAAAHHPLRAAPAPVQRGASPEPGRGRLPRALRLLARAPRRAGTRGRPCSRSRRTSSAAWSPSV